MPARPTLAIILALMLCGVPADARQRESLRERVRQEGDVMMHVISCGPTLGLREILANTELTVEGIVSEILSGLTLDDSTVYTDYTVDVRRLLRLALRPDLRSLPGASLRPSPFANGRAPGTNSSTAVRVRFRVIHQGTVQLDGGKATAYSNSPVLHQGDHIVASMAFYREIQAWTPLGVFAVREGRVVPIGDGLEPKAYASVDEFAAALAKF